MSFCHTILISVQTSKKSNEKRKVLTFINFKEFLPYKSLSVYKQVKKSNEKRKVLNFIIFKEFLPYKSLSVYKRVKKGHEKRNFLTFIIFKTSFCHTNPYQCTNE